MCYTVALKIKRIKHEAHVGAKKIVITEIGDRISGFSHQNHPIITSQTELIPNLMSWGLIPNWCKTVAQASEIQNMTLNAKSETVGDKPSFRHLINANRCLVPVTGFYEWKTIGKTKIPYYIHLKDVEVFYLAGLYDEWLNPLTDLKQQTFTILTTAANELMAEIHNTKQRMPCILLPQSHDNWLNIPINNKDLSDYLQPIPSDMMTASIIREKPINPTLF